MADLIDKANDLIEGEFSLALKRIRQNVAQEGMGVKNCIECGDDIPAARQKLGFKLCVPCAEEAERRNLLFAGD